MRIPQDNPIEQLRKELPRGAGDWPGEAIVYRRLAHIAEQMGRNRYQHLSDLHIKTMAVMGTGHEETMKAHLHLLVFAYGWDLLADTQDAPVGSGEPTQEA
jgi:hypothetical protein